MKKVLFAILLILLSLPYLYDKTFAAGQVCCDTLSSWSYSTLTDKCVRGFSEIESTKCNINLNEICDASTNTCFVTGTTPAPKCGGEKQSCCVKGFGGCTVDSFYCVVGEPVMSDCVCSCIISPPSAPTIPVYDPTCASGGPYGINYGGVKTALGCLPTDPQAFINTATPWAVGIGAGIAFLLGILGSVMIVLSAGNPEKMQAGKEMITSAVGGLILIVFSVFLLRIIGVDVLKLF